MAKYVQEFEEVRKGVETKRLSNSKEGLEYLDRGFSKVMVEGDIPYNFMSVDEGETSAYLVNLNYIGYDALTTGQDYPKFEAEGDSLKTVTFGKDDVYVYDSKGRVFYARGFMDSEGNKYHESIDKDNGIEIVKIDKIISPDNTYVEVTITIESDKDVKKVTVGDQEAVKQSEEKYKVTITENGTFDVKAEDVDGNMDKSSVTITEIGSTTGPTVTAKVTNGTLDGGVYVITEKTAKLELTSDTATSLHISISSDAPTSWLAFTENVERYFETEGEYTLYIWVKDNFGNTSGIPKILKIRVALDKGTKPELPDENIQNGAIDFNVEPSEGTWSNSKIVTISFTEGRQSDGYTSRYSINVGTGWSDWMTSYTPEAKVEVTRNNTQIKAEIIYSSVYKNETIAEANTVVGNIDTTPPKITDFRQQSIGEITATMSDNQSKLASYLIIMEYVDFENESRIEDYTWSSFPADTAETTVTSNIDTDGRYYLYVRDHAGNISSSSINAEAPDRIKPVIESIAATSIKDYAVIKAVARDNIGVTGYALTRTSGDIPAEADWITVAETEIVSIEYNNIREDGIYFVWVRDAAGNTQYAPVEVKLFRLPVLDTNYPQSIYVEEGDTASFEIVIAQAGYPDEYKYSWQVSKDDGATWTTISGATSSTYSFTAKYEDNNNLYRCLIDHPRDVVISNIAKLEVARITNDKPAVTIVEDKEMVLGGVMINNGATSTTNSTLSLKVVGINIAEVSISEDGTKSGTWVPYAETISYTLKGSSYGTKTISGWARDSAGN